MDTATSSIQQFVVNQFVPHFGVVVEVTEFAGRKFLTFVGMDGLTEVIPASEVTSQD